MYIFGDGNYDMNFTKDLDRSSFASAGCREGRDR